jgi:predicted DCC family thiol-disulfide oxidoreductase YuxK
MGWVVFFDGDCGFCSQSVRWLARLDKAGRIDFAPLQGSLAARHGFSHQAERDGTVVLLRESDGRIFTRSDSLIEIGRVLGGVWHIPATIATLIPRPLRDFFYRMFARNRLRIMGKSTACGMPDPEWLKRLRE